MFKYLFYSLCILVMLACTPKQESEKATGTSDSTSGIVEENDLCICMEVYAPVCGDDGKTYSNSCHAGCAGVKSFTEGACQQDK